MNAHTELRTMRQAVSARRGKRYTEIGLLRGTYYRLTFLLPYPCVRMTFPPHDPETWCKPRTSNRRRRANKES